MIFVTVGTVAPFDRLISLADGLAAASREDAWFAQIGTGGFEPKHIEFTKFLNKADYDRHVWRSDFIIAHGGIGIVSDALKAGKPLLVVPRTARLGEHVNDHQVETAKFYADNGHVLVANEGDDLAPLFKALRHFTPKQRTSQPARVADRVGEFLRGLQER
jgi:UDP-N-acetylglucosamine transferase subunit ALG13